LLRGGPDHAGRLHGVGKSDASDRRLNILEVECRRSNAETNAIDKREASGSALGTGKNGAVTSAQKWEVSRFGKKKRHLRNCHWGLPITRNSLLKKGKGGRKTYVLALPMA